MKCLFYPLVFGIVLTSGCTHQPRTEDPVAVMGLTETALGRAVIEKAVDIANSWINPELGMRFAPSWQKQDLKQAKGVIPVYSIAELHAPATDIVAVPTHCHCVFVQPRAYEKWLENHISHTSQTLEVSEERLLAFMLLHEAGHLVHGDPGEFDASSTGSLNTDATNEKQREQAADSFAVEQLKNAMQRKKDVAAWLSAQYASADLANLAFEMQQVREERYFGAESLGTLQAFYDLGYSHPNLELRLLTMNDQISETPTSHELLSNFLARRARHNPVLFREPSSALVSH